MEKLEFDSVIISHRIVGCYPLCYWAVTNDAQQRILLELLERRFGNVSTIFCSQYNEEGWHDQLGGSAIAESILDRITPNSYKITIQGDVSMRQRLGADD